MTDNSSHETEDVAATGDRAADDAVTDGGVATGAAQQHRQTDRKSVV